MKEKRLKGKRVLAVVPTRGFRDEELEQPMQILESEGVEVKVASTVEGTCAAAKLSSLKAPARAESSGASWQNAWRIEVRDARKT